MAAAEVLRAGRTRRAGPSPSGSIVRRRAGPSSGRARSGSESGSGSGSGVPARAPAFAAPSRRSPGIRGAGSCGPSPGLRAGADGAPGPPGSRSGPGAARGGGRPARLRHLHGRAPGRGAGPEASGAAGGRQGAPGRGGGRRHPRGGAGRRAGHPGCSGWLSGPLLHLAHLRAAHSCPRPGGAAGAGPWRRRAAEGGRGAGRDGTLRRRTLWRGTLRRRAPRTRKKRMTPKEATEGYRSRTPPSSPRPSPA